MRSAVPLLAAQLIPEGRPLQLVVVKRDRFSIFTTLERMYADDPLVRVIWDRRVGERRQTETVGSEAPDRRRRDRRREPPASWSDHHFLRIPAVDQVRPGTPSPIT